MDKMLKEVPPSYTDATTVGSTPHTVVVDDPEKPQDDLKYDGGKIMAAIPFQDFPDAIKDLCRVSTMGAEKYERHSWMEVPDKKVRYTDAFARHFLSSFHEDVDPESKISHLAHLAWNCLALLQMEYDNEE